MHGRHVLAHRCDQIVVDLNRNILPRHRHSTGGRIVAGCGLGCRRLDSAGVGRSKGVDVLAVALVIAVEGVLRRVRSVLISSGTKLEPVTSTVSPFPS